MNIFKHIKCRWYTSISPFLQDQWKKSMAKVLWDDLTILGRLTVWIPLWVAGVTMLVIILPTLALLFLGGKLIGKLPEFNWIAHFKYPQQLRIWKPAHLRKWKWQ